MRLLIIRHAIAIPRGTGGIPDAERTLTPEGAERFREAAIGLARIAPCPDTLLTSPLPRARRTAEIAAEAWGGVSPRNVEALAGGSVAAVTTLLSRYPPGATVALVGHEPHLSELLAALLGEADADRLAFKKGGAACVEFEGPVRRGGQLRWFLPPKILRRLAQG
ncbi:MAG: histidine phosphatase family protein [Deltaproteobacteria bacterium]|nr:histidine phosphatase family protein [Deltaproteobacteria bacterium]